MCDSFVYLTISTYIYFSIWKYKNKIDEHVFHA